MFFLNLVRLAPLGLQFLRSHSQRNLSTLDAFLEPFHLKYRRKLEPSVRVKIQDYALLIIPLFCTINKKLYGATLSNREKEAALLTGICTPLIDNFADNRTLDSEAINRLTLSPWDYEPKTMEEDIVKELGSRLLQNLKRPADFIQALKQVIEAQALSQEQLDSNLESDNLLRISLHKGGVSQILSHHLIDEEPTQETIAMLYRLGGIMQLNDDLFDVYVDHHENISTYANRCADYSAFANYYLNECKRFVAETRALPLKNRNKESFITLFSFTLALGMVALRQLRNLQTKKGVGVLPVSDLDRRLLITDMENPINILRLARFAYRIQS